MREVGYQGVQRKQFYISAEIDLVTSLVQAAVDAGVRVDQSAVINLYVTLKSRPLVILAGQANTGKVAALQAVANVLTGGDTARFLVLAGHAWWAGRSGDVGLFTEAQTRLNVAAISDLIAEAWLPENARRVLIACLAGVSPAEVAGLFTDVAFQLHHGLIMQISGFHLPHPIPYPPNLLLVGTMDADHFEPPNTDLLEMATVIRWPGVRKAVPRTGTPANVAGEETFLCVRVRTEREACLKLSRVLEQDPGYMQPFFQVERVLRQHGCTLPSCVREAVLIFLANAWDDSGRGLFDRHGVRQRTIALDLSLAQIVLPYVTNVAADRGLYPRLKSVLGENFPHTAMMLDGMSHR